MNIEIIQNIYTFFKKKDLPAILKLQTDDVVWSVVGPANKIPWAGPQYGHEGVSNFLKVFGGILIPEIFEIKEYFENGNKVVALGFQKGYVKETNVPYFFEFVHLWELNEKKSV